MNNNFSFALHHEPLKLNTSKASISLIDTWIDSDWYTTNSQNCDLRTDLNNRKAQARIVLHKHTVEHTCTSHL